MFLSGKRPADLGMHGGALSPCPDTPNCVLSQATDRQHAITPFSFKADPAKEMERIHEILRSMTGVTVITLRKITCTPNAGRCSWDLWMTLSFSGTKKKRSAMYGPPPGWDIRIWEKTAGGWNSSGGSLKRALPDLSAHNKNGS